MANILCVDDTPADLEVLAFALQQAGHEVQRAEHVPQALALLESEKPDLIVSDYRLPKVSGLEFLKLLHRRGLSIPLIMSTAYATVDDAVSSLKAGAVDYVPKPIRPDQLRFAVDQALALTDLRRANDLLQDEASRLKVRRQILGDSSALREVLDIVTRVAPTRATVLVQGESGTGKELIARAIHDLSDRSRGPFIALNCAAIPEQLVESALFGHEKGAFTGAIKRVAGAFERAHGGTLFLDEISEMRVDLQGKLLRALQEHEFERVGGTTSVRVDARVVATTNRDLADHVMDGHFREDLFFRLSVVPIVVPPLRDRPEDIITLANTFARRCAEENGKEVSGISREAASMLRRYDWPGNVRELEHAVERAVILSQDPSLVPANFVMPGTFLRRRSDLPEAGPTVTPPGANLGRRRSDTAIDGLGDDDGQAPHLVLRNLNVRAAEEELIREALRVTGGNRTRASELLGINPRTLRTKLNGR